MLFGGPSKCFASGHRQWLMGCMCRILDRVIANGLLRPLAEEGASILQCVIQWFSVFRTLVQTSNPMIDNLDEGGVLRELLKGIGLVDSANSGCVGV